MDEIGATIQVFVSQLSENTTEKTVNSSTTASVLTENDVTTDWFRPKQNKVTPSNKKSANRNIMLGCMNEVTQNGRWSVSELLFNHWKGPF